MQQTKFGTPLDKDYLAQIAQNFCGSGARYLVIWKGARMVVPFLMKLQKGADMDVEFMLKEWYICLRSSEDLSNPSVIEHLHSHRFIKENVTVELIT